MGHSKLGGFEIKMHSIGINKIINFVKIYDLSDIYVASLFEELKSWGGEHREWIKSDATLKCRGLTTDA